MRIGRLSRLWPGARARGECLRCHTSFKFSPPWLTIAESPLLPKVIPITALCGRCHADLSPAERIPYYQQWAIRNRGPNPRENEIRWAAIYSAVSVGA